MERVGESERDSLKKEEPEKMEEIAIHSYRASLVDRLI